MTNLNLLVIAVIPSASEGSLIPFGTALMPFLSILSIF